MEVVIIKCKRICTYCNYVYKKDEFKKGFTCSVCFGDKVNSFIEAIVKIPKDIEFIPFKISIDKTSLL